MKSEITKFSHSLAAEHYELTKNSEGNLNYLWYLYYEGSKKGLYKPFIFFAELNLLHYLKIITDDEKEGLAKMLHTEPSSDDFYIGYLALKEFRKKRHKAFGANINAPKYDNVKKDYCYAILNHALLFQLNK